MSNNLKDDVKNAVPVNKNGGKSKESIFKKPKNVAYCIIDTNSLFKDIVKEKDTDKNTDEK